MLYIIGYLIGAVVMFGFVHRVSEEKVDVMSFVLTLSWPVIVPYLVGYALGYSCE